MSELTRPEIKSAMLDIMADAMAEVMGPHGLTIADDANLSQETLVELAEAALEALMTSTGLRIVPVAATAEAGVWMGK